MFVKILRCFCLLIMIVRFIDHYCHCYKYPIVLLVVCIFSVIITF